MSLIYRHLTAVVFVFLFVFSQSAASGPSFEEKLISDVGWSVTLLDFSYDPVSNTTTLSYELNASIYEKDLSHWVLGIDIDNTGLTSIFPEELTSYGLDPTTGLVGIKWDAGQGAGTTAIYSVTVPGNVGLIDVSYTVKGGTYYATGITQGPGKGVVVNESTFSVSGSVYVDANGNNLFDVGEPVFNVVTVELYDVDGNLVSTVLSDTAGMYQFDNLLPGDYSVSIPQNTIVNDFNNILFDYFYPGVGTSMLISVLDTDAVVDIGFIMNTVAILDDLNSEDPDVDGFSFPGEGRTIGFWKHQLSVAIKGKGRAHVDATTLTNYLNSIENFLLVEPFQFTNGMEYVHAHSIMANRTSVAVELLEKQLLGTELNHVAGLGLSGEYVALQHMILAWSEFLAANHMLYSREELLLAKDILDTINNMGH